MFYRPLICTLLLSLFSIQSFAEAEVDAADSLDFEAFHHPEKPQPENQQPENQQPATTQLKVTRTPPKQNNVAARGSYHVSEYYSLGNSVHTSYSAFSVIEALHYKMAKYCPKGWEKLHEWVERQANTNVLRMNYQFRCLP